MSSECFVMNDKKFQILKRQRPWRTAYFYQKSEVIYQMTFVFCKRFLAPIGDRTVDQMIQAARSGKQNIVEGTEDGVTSTEMHIKLLNVARSSIQELREDYRDYLLSRNLTIWNEQHNRYKNMQDFCRYHNKIEDYQPFFPTWNDEEMANTALTLCYMVDTMLNHHLITIETEFVTHGGIKERMYSARTRYRQKQGNEIMVLKQKITEQEAEISRLKELLIKNGIIDSI